MKFLQPTEALTQQTLGKFSVVGNETVTATTKGAVYFNAIVIIDGNAVISAVSLSGDDLPDIAAGDPTEVSKGASTMYGKFSAVTCDTVDGCLAYHVGE